VALSHEDDISIPLRPCDILNIMLPNRQKRFVLFLLSRSFYWRFIPRFDSLKDSRCSHSKLSLSRFPLTCRTLSSRRLQTFVAPVCLAKTLPTLSPYLIQEEPNITTTLNYNKFELINNNVTVPW
jgi:hypothetical protein